jgi:hypothetical protein
MFQLIFLRDAALLIGRVEEFLVQVVVRDEASELLTKLLATCNRPPTQKGDQPMEGGRQ